MSLTISAPNLSPSLNENDEAVITDPNGNQIPLVALVHPDTLTGANEVGTATVIPGVVSQVTGRRGKPQINVPGIGNVPVLAVYNMNTNGTGVSKAGGKFQSAVTVATGSSQNVAHGLNAVPSLVLIAPYDNTASGSTPFTFQIVEGAHTSTNVVLTATAGLKFKVIAFV